MRRFKLIVNTGFAGAIHEEEIELTDDMVDLTDENEVEEYLQEQIENMIVNHIEGYWKEIS